MSGPITRKIELTRQLEEMRLLVGQQATELPARARRDRLPAGMVVERLDRQAAIVKTLEWLKENEADVRGWISAQRGQSDAGTDNQSEG